MGGRSATVFGASTKVPSATRATPWQVRLLFLQAEDKRG